jgi:hypothetical protein
MTIQTDFLKRHGRKLLLVPLALIAAWLISALAVAQPNTPAAALQAALQRAADAGSYQIRIDLVQTIYARPDQPPAAGFPDHQGVHLAIDGAFGGVDRARLTVKPAETGARLPVANDAPQTFIIRGDEVYQSAGDAWQKLDDTVPTPGLNTDALSLLKVAQAVQWLDPVERLTGRYQRVTFTLPPREVSRYLLQQQGQLSDQNLAVVQAGGAGFGGTGELWIDAQGYPARLALNLDLNRRGEDAYRTLVASTADYSQFGAQFPASMFDPTIAPLSGAALSPFPGSGLTFAQTTQLGALLLALFAGLALAVWLMARSATRTRRIKMTIVSVIVIAGLIAPSVAAAAPATANRGAADQPAGVSELLNTLQQTRQIAQQNRFGPNAIAAATLSDQGDEDGDGLPNGYELQLGTNPLIVDSDLDGLTDVEEVKGFECNYSNGATTVQTNPLEPDSNNDGLRDGDEFRNGACGFVRKAGEINGTPYPWADDNDNDGVIDGLDLSPFSASGSFGGIQVTGRNPNTGYVPGHIYTNLPGTNLNFESIDSDPSAVTVPYPFYVDVQIRPANHDLLRAAYKTSLEWPVETEGNIRNNGTGGDAVLASILLGKDYVSNGKLQVVPFLQAKVAAKDLPSAAVRQQYGLGVALVNPQCILSCTFYLTIPLVKVERGGQVYALQARVLHDFAGGNTHLLRKWQDVRLRWAVQGDIVRANADGDFLPDPNGNLGVIIYDTPYKITGMQVSRQGGAQVLLAGAAASGPQLLNDAPTALLRAGLEARFLNGQITLQEIKDRFDLNSPMSNTKTITEHWGITQPFGITVSPVYPHLDMALATTAMTTSRQLLNQLYPTHGVSPTLILASEQRTSTINLDELKLSSEGAYHNITINTCAKPLVTSRTLKLQTYRWDPTASPNGLIPAVSLREGELGTNALTKQSPDTTPEMASHPSTAQPENAAPLGTTVMPNGPMLLGDWIPLSLDEVLAKTANEFAQAFPEIQQAFDQAQAYYETAEQLYNEALNIMQLATTAWHMGQTVIDQIGSFDIENVSVSDVETFAHFLESNGILPTSYAKAVYVLLDVYEAGGPHIWLEQQFNQIIAFAEGVFGSFANGVPSLSLPTDATTILSYTNTAINWLNFLATVTGFDWLADVANILTKAIEIYKTIKYAIDAVNTFMSLAQSSIATASDTAQALVTAAVEEMKALAGSLSLLGLVLQVGMVWLGLAITLLSNDLPPLVVSSLVARAIVETAILVAIFVIATAVPYGWVIMVVFALGKALEAIFGVNIEPISAFLDWLFGVEITQYSWVKGDPKSGSVQFEQIDPQGGLVQGNTFRFSITSTVRLGAISQSYLAQSDAGIRIGFYGGGNDCVNLLSCGTKEFFYCEPTPQAEESIQRFDEYGWLTGSYEEKAFDFTCYGIQIEDDVHFSGDPAQSIDNIHWVWSNVPLWDTTYGPTNHYVVNDENRYARDVNTYAYADFTPHYAGINTWVPLDVEFQVGTINNVCSPWLEVEGECYNYTDFSTSNPNFTKVYFDILPSSLEGLLAWSAAGEWDSNPRLKDTDPDHDGLWGYIQPIKIGNQTVNVPTGPDGIACGSSGAHRTWDTDGDGLSDKFEYDSFVASFGALLSQSGQSVPVYSMCFKDSDNDGLDDGRELALGTLPNDPDTDNDGLRDGQEAVYWELGTWWSDPGHLVTPWTIPLSARYAGLPDPIAFPNPRQSNQDHDHRNDWREKLNHSSPNAYNFIPDNPLSLAIEPQLTAGGGTQVRLLTNDWLIDLPAITQATLVVTLPVQMSNFVSSVKLYPPIGNPQFNTGSLAINSGPLVYTWILPPIFSNRSISATISGLPAITTDPVTITAAIMYTYSNTQKVAAAFAPFPINLSGPTVTIDQPANDALQPAGALFISGNASDAEGVKDVYVCAKLTDNCAGADWKKTGGTQPWQVTWAPAADGIYLLRAYGVDVYGVSGPASAPISVKVDRVAPSGATFDRSGTLFLTTEVLSSTLDTLFVTGRITDTNSAGFTSGAGQAVVLIDDGRGSLTQFGRYNTVPVDQPGQLGSAFTFSMSLPHSGFGGALNGASSAYTLTLGGVDLAGNYGAMSQTLRIVVDDHAPLVYSRVPQTAAGSSITLSGRADDTALLPGRTSTPAYTPTMALANANTAITLTASASTAQIVGDLNGDTIDDVVVVNPSGGGLVPLALQAGLFFGKPQGLSTTLNLNNADVRLFGEATGPGAFAPAVAGNLDVNGDGLGDLLIGDPHVGTDAGAAYLILGRRNWPAMMNLVNADWRLTRAGTVGFGGSITSAGDVDGDGLSDMLVGAASDGVNSGIAYLYLGRERGAAPLRSIMRSPHCNTCAPLTPPNLAGLGDTNGDGLSDFLIAYAGSGGFVDATALVAGRPQADWPSTATPATLTSFATALFVAPGTQQTVSPVGDVDGDGLRDMLIGDPTSGLPRLFVVVGRRPENAWPLPPATIDLTTQADASYLAAGGIGLPRLGAAMTPLGDLDNDGLADFAFGHPGTGSGPNRTGIVLAGEMSHTLDMPISAADMYIAGSAGSQRSGEFVSSGDINGDNVRDILIGAPGEFKAYVIEGQFAPSAVAGVKSVEVGVYGPVIDPSLPVTQTLPAAWQVATLSLPNQSITPWSAQVSPNGDGDYRVYARAFDQADNGLGAISWYLGNVWINSAPVTLTGASAVLNAPQLISKTQLSLSGSVTSAQPIQALRVYNGYEWRRMAPVLGAWNSDSIIPQSDLRTLTMREVGRDAFGNTLHVTRTLTTDTLAVAPRLYANLNAHQWYVNITPTLTITWPTLVDGSGFVSQWASIDTTGDTIPTTTAALPQVSKLLDQPGVYYGHVRALDGAGNDVVQHIGPFLINRMPTPGVIHPDGYLDLNGGEYPNGTLLNYDPFGPVKSIGMWGTWDAANLYLAYRGANWSSAHQLAIYLDTQAGGLNQTRPAFGRTHALPFDADYAYILNGTNQLYAASGGAWVEVPASQSKAVLGAATEIVLKRSEIAATGAVKLLAFSQDSLGVQAVLPAHARPNLEPVYTDTVSFAGALQWNTLSNGVLPDAGQYQALAPSINIDPGENTTLYTNTTTLMTITVQNADFVPYMNVPLTVTVGPTQGQQLMGLIGVASGASCQSCAANAKQWVLRVNVAANSVQTITLTPKTLVPAATGLYTLPVTAQLDRAGLPHEPQAPAEAYYWLDYGTPQIRVYTNRPIIYRRPGTAIDIGFDIDPSTLLRCSADLEVNTGAGWQPICRLGECWGWSGEITAQPIDVQILINSGNGTVSPAIGQTVIADSIAPTASITPSVLLQNGAAIITGLSHDAFPTTQPARRVEISVNGGRFLPAVQKGIGGSGLRSSTASLQDSAQAAATTSTASWAFPVALGQSDGEMISVVARAIDEAGNVGPNSAPITITVDNLGPQITVVNTGDVIDGLVMDGSGVASVAVSLDGGMTYRPAELAEGGNWSFNRAAWPGAQISFVIVRAADVWDNLSQVTETAESVKNYRVYLPLIVR